MPTIESLPRHSGAQFFRADLHIHSYAASHDVTDTTMTSENIVAAAMREGLSIIAIADHNEISNVESAHSAAQGTSVTVIPAVELSTPQGHLLCYLPSVEALQRFYGQLSIADRRTQNSRCQQSILDCLNLLLSQDGFGILAHVDVASGFEVEVPGYSPHKADVLKHQALLGIELKHSSSTISFSDNDPDPHRAKIGRDRITQLNLGSKQHIARVLNSDSHTLNALGRNAANLKRVTRLKMDTPSFEGVKLALSNADARVRIEDEIPEIIPKILGAHIDGGFLSGQAIQFSQNLNCIIGGRGTGKSTIFEAIRCLASSASDSKVIDSEIWPDELHLFWHDQAGQVHSLRRLKDGETENLDDESSGPRSFEIDCFGQGDAAKISIEAQSNPLALLRYLDRFVDMEEALNQEEQTREQLLSLQTEIEKAESNVQQITHVERQLATTKQQLTALQKPEVKELIDLHRQLATERELRKQITEGLGNVKQETTRAAKRTALEGICNLDQQPSLTVGNAEFQLILSAAQLFASQVNAANTQIEAGLKDLEKVTAAQIGTWKQKESTAQTRIDAKRRELEALNVQFDMSYIAKLTKDEATHQQSLNALRTWEPHLRDLKKQRAAALKLRWQARNRVGTLRDAFARQATDTLRNVLSDLQVSLKYAQSAYSPDAVDQIIQAMGWRTNQQPRARQLVEGLTVPNLIAAIDKNDPSSILALRTPEGVTIFNNEDANNILANLSQPSVKFALERVKIHDLPKLQVSRTGTDENGKTRRQTREFSKLSLGQQQSVLLALILSSESNRPLIIDQPEDNLDGEFIYATLVPVLRRAKERRQVIIVTHNANVAVLGDAELIVVMKAANDHGLIWARGSIDNESTRDAALNILEGAREAFLRRAAMYGVKLRH